MKRIIDMKYARTGYQQEGVVLDDRDSMFVKWHNGQYQELTKQKLQEVHHGNKRYRVTTKD